MSKARDLADLGAVTSRLDTVGASDGALSHRRLTYNGAMNVWQRGTSADTASNGDYMCDRWQIAHSGLDGNVDWDQEASSTPDGFAYALKVSTDASETSLDASDYAIISQRFEGQDLQHLQKGSSGAKKLALSFWVRSSVASTYTVDLYDQDNTRSISKSYAINTADTWEYKTLVFEGDTSGALDNDANLSLHIHFWLDAGSTFTSGTFSTAWQANDNAERVYDTTGWLESSSPTFYITGVQLEVGSQSTDFEHRSFGDELARCQRYFYKATFEGGPIIDGYTTTSIFNRYSIPFPVTMRAIPSSSGSLTGSSSNVRSGDNSTTASNLGTTSAAVQFRAASTGRSYQTTNSGDVLKFDAEL